MSRQDRERVLSDMIDLDDAYVDGLCEARYGRGTGQSTAGVAVAINDEGRAMYTKMRVVEREPQNGSPPATLGRADGETLFRCGYWRRRPAPDPDAGAGPPRARSRWRAVGAERHMSQECDAAGRTGGSETHERLRYGGD